MAASDSEGPRSHSKWPGSKAATASRHGISPPEASSTGAVLAPRMSTALPGPHGAPLLGLALTATNTQSHSWPGRTLYRRLHGPHVQLAVPSFPPWGPRALLCQGTPPAMEAREGHHMRRDWLGPKQGKGARGGHLCGASREEREARSDREGQQTRTGRAGGEGHMRCLVIRKTESWPAT